MINVIKNRYLLVGSSFLVVLFSLIVMIFGEKNLGIDMTGGTQSEFEFTTEINLEEITKKIEEQKEIFNSENQNIINGMSVYRVSGENKIVIETGFNKMDEKTLEKYKISFNELVINTLNKDEEKFTLHKYVNIGQSFGDYIKKTAWITLGISLFGIGIYIAFAFFGVAVGVSASSFAFVAILTQFHDIVVATGLYIFTSMFYPEFKIDTFFITALLTILGYSINDTIVVFDRIRENITKYIKTKKLDEIINISIEETIERSIYTSLTLMFVLITILFFGPESLKGFMLVMIYGVAFGTYSSIFVAAPLLYEVNKNKTLKVYEKKVVSDDDKIVV